MSDKAWELAYWPANEAYQKDASSTIAPFVEILRAQKGIGEIRAGLQTETPAVWVVVAWDTLEDHLDLINRKEEYAELIRRLNLTRSDPDKIDMAHAKFVSDPRPAFSAPATEFAYTVAKEGVTREKLVGILDAIVAHLTNSESIAVGAAYGPLVEKPNTLLLVVGWQTVQDHVKAVQTEPMAGLVQELISNTEAQVMHAGLVLF